MANRQRDKMLQIRLSEEELKKLDAIARRKGQTRAAIIRLMLLEYDERESALAPKGDGRLR